LVAADKKTLQNIFSFFVRQGEKLWLLAKGIREEDSPLLNCGDSNALLPLCYYLPREMSPKKRFLGRCKCRVNDEMAQDCAVVFCACFFVDWGA
jgi:hypothetical protein